MTIHGLWVRLDPVAVVSCTECVYSKVINKAGGLVYQRNFSGLRHLRIEALTVTQTTRRCITTTKFE